MTYSDDAVGAPALVCLVNLGAKENDKHLVVFILHGLVDLIFEVFDGSADKLDHGVCVG